MTDSSRNPQLQRLLDLEARYDGPIPAAERRALALGSAAAAARVTLRAEIAFYRAMIVRARRAGKAWLARGNREMAAHVRDDSRLYLNAWRDRRRALAEHLHRTESRRAMRLDEAHRHTLAVIASHIIAPLIEGAGESRP